MVRFTNQCLVLVATLSLVSAVQAVTVSAPFGDQMVLQRDAKISVWGTALPEAKITLKFGEKTATARADVNGGWRLFLGPLAASATPETLTVSSDQEEQTVSLKDVLVGEVWVGSGQSNMAGRVASYAKNDETLAAIANVPEHANIRLLNGGPKPSWKKATRENVAPFSALLFAYGERLSRELEVPVGLIVGAVGGTPSGAWIPAETFATSPLCQKSVEEFAKTYDEAAAMRRYKAKLAAWEKQSKAAEADGKKPRGRKPEPPKGPGEPTRGRNIGSLYERYIQPVVGYRIRGVLWDQGEARSGVVGVDQFTMMTELIRGWREAWGQGSFPFLFVQKSSGGGCAFTNDDPVTRNGDAFQKLPAKVPLSPPNGRGVDRAMYVELMQAVENGWMVPVCDLGSGIHPTNKWGYGNRSAQVALAKVYERDVQAYGPTYRSHVVSGGKVTVSFDEVGGGLTTAHSDELQGFALAGADGKWHWARAKIDGNTVLVSSDDVPNPTQLRFAYAQKRAWANLFNQNGLPALAFEVTLTDPRQ